MQCVIANCREIETAKPTETDCRETDCREIHTAKFKPHNLDLSQSNKLHYGIVGGLSSLDSDTKYWLINECPGI